MIHRRHIADHALIVGLLFAAGRDHHARDWLGSLLTAVATHTAGADPAPVSGAWS